MNIFSHIFNVILLGFINKEYLILNDIVLNKKGNIIIKIVAFRIINKEYLMLNDIVLMKKGNIIIKIVAFREWGETIIPYYNIGIYILDFLEEYLR